MNEDIKALIKEAITNIKEGRTEDALLVLERTVDPKFDSRLDAWVMHDNAINRRAGA